MKPWGEEHTVIEGDTDKTRIFLPQEEGKEAPEENEGPLIFAWLVGLTEPHLDRSFRIASERFHREEPRQQPHHPGPLRFGPTCVHILHRRGLLRRRPSLQQRNHR